MAKARLPPPSESSSVPGAGTFGSECSNSSSTRAYKERLEDTVDVLMAILSQRSAVLEDVDALTAYARDMSEFLKEIKITERRASSRPSSRRS